MKIPKIKMLILDVDGTMTDNGIYIDENGIESKRYNPKDGIGIYELIKKGMLTPTDLDFVLLFVFDSSI